MHCSLSFNQLLVLLDGEKSSPVSFFYWKSDIQVVIKGVFSSSYLGIIVFQKSAYCP